MLNIHEDESQKTASESWERLGGFRCDIYDFLVLNETWNQTVILMETMYVGDTQEKSWIGVKQLKHSNLIVQQQHEEESKQRKRKEEKGATLAEFQPHAQERHHAPFLSSAN